MSCGRRKQGKTRHAKRCAAHPNTITCGDAGQTCASALAQEFRPQSPTHCGKGCDFCNQSHHAIHRRVVCLVVSVGPSVVSSMAMLAPLSGGVSSFAFVPSSCSPDALCPVFYFLPRRGTHFPALAMGWRIRQKPARWGRFSLSTPQPRQAPRT